MRGTRITGWGIAAFCSLAVVLGAGPQDEAREVIARRCLGFHSAQAKTAGLDLSTVVDALKGGSKGPAIHPGSSKGSLLIARVESGSMPPAKPLPPRDREVAPVNRRGRSGLGRSDFG